MGLISKEQWLEATGGPAWLKSQEEVSRTKLVEVTLSNYLKDQSEDNDECAVTLSELYGDEFDNSEHDLPVCEPTQSEAKAFVARMMKAKKVARKEHDGVFYYKWVGK